MLSIVSITVAFVIGIAWGLYLESNILVLALIFLLVIMLCLIYKKILVNLIILIVIAIIGYSYSSYRLSKFDNKYNEGEYMRNSKNNIT